MAQGRLISSLAHNSLPRVIHFPKLKLVGIVDADLGLGNGDPRAAERTFQMLHQVLVARAVAAAGVSVICKHISPSIRSCARLFLATATRLQKQIEQREPAGYPPFGRLASFVVTANDRHSAETYGRTLRKCCAKNPDVRVLGRPKRRLPLYVAVTDFGCL